MQAKEAAKMQNLEEEEGGSVCFPQAGHFVGLLNDKTNFWCSLVSMS